MSKQILVITYAVPEELEVGKVLEVVNEQKRNWIENRIDWFKRLKVKMNRRYYDKEVVLVETGIGKVNSYKELKMIVDLAADYLGRDTEITVLNLGTAASMNEGIGSVVECNRFIDRDLIRIGYGDNGDYTIYTVDGTPRFLSEMDDRPDNDLGGKFSFGYSCNSGDTFVTNPEEAHQMRDGWTAVCDMEGFSQAKLISESLYKFSEPIKFHCIKYITDKIGEDNTVEGWKEELPAACISLTKTAMEYIRDFYNSK